MRHTRQDSADILVPRPMRACSSRDDRARRAIATNKSHAVVEMEEEILGIFHFIAVGLHAITTCRQ